MNAALGLATMVSCTIIANVLMKIGASSPTTNGTILGIVHWKTLAGLAFFGCAGLVYAWVLKFIPLNVAQSFIALQFVGVVLAAAIILAEPIPFMRWVGIAMIAAGIAIVGFGDVYQASS